jgi:hypothetical protein
MTDDAAPITRCADDQRGAFTGLASVFANLDRRR